MFGDQLVGLRKHCMYSLQNVKKTPLPKKCMSGICYYTASYGVAPVLEIWGV